MTRYLLSLASSLVLLLLHLSTPASAAIVEHSFHVQNLTVRRLCTEQVLTAVNGGLPGPTLRVHEGDTLVVHVFNKSPYNLTIHWHGVFQMLTAWADGPEMITQCPIQPGGNYTYRFNVTKQEGTLWWHAHSSVLRAYVHGALIIRPRSGRSYPFPKPYKEFPIVLGEWFNGNIVDIEKQALANGVPPNNSDAYLINGRPGDLFPCSEDQIYKLKIKAGKTYLLRMVNAALNNELFFKIGNHNMTVVSVDAQYTTPYETEVVVIAPGQTTDVLLKADQPIGSYYMAASTFAAAPQAPVDNKTTRGIITYEGAPSNATPVMPQMPFSKDLPTAYKFYSNLTGLVGGPWWVPVPLEIDEHMFVTINLNLAPCPTCANGRQASASMNNVSFQPPTTLSLLQASFFNVSGIYTTDFPDNPPIQFDYTNPATSTNSSLFFAPKATKVKKMKYNATVEMVLQNTAILSVDNHPMHIHGFDFHVLAQGFGNYDPVNDPSKFNLVNPQMRNTVAVPDGGWAVIRFTANNPGVWFMHCHIEAHLPWGLATAIEVENGPTPETTLPPPPADLPQC